MAGRSGRGRQAVVVIHGIGEQRPMNTLRGFVEGLLADGDDGARIYSKPDRLSDTLELRRLAAFPPTVPVATDFYELYWAHLMQGTVWSHVAAWVRMLMFRPPWCARGPVIGLWLACWATTLGAAAALALHGAPEPAKLLGTGALGLLLYGLAKATGFFGLRYIGDAARYLSALPENVETRKNIRNAVLALLSKLHDEQPRRYDRIVVVGHSLGSVIAYDALTQFWQMRHTRTPAGAQAPNGQPALDALGRAGRALLDIDRTTPPPEAARRLGVWRRAQRALWSEQGALGIDWRITDLVTLGSPLSHGEFLLADDPRDWARRKAQRELPTSPPQPQDRRDQGRLVVHYPDPHGGSLQLLHHAALFACTRWTNLYFAADWIGGPVGGPGRLGAGIADVRLRARGWLARWTPAAHLRYWDARQRDAVQQLRRALHLHEGAGPVAPPRG